MTKKEFLAQMEKKLSLISDKERTDILMEYSAYIDDKMSDGASEAEAVAGFGDLNELAKDILEAYKINTNSIESKTDKTLDKAFTHAENLAHAVGNLEMNQVAHMVFDGIILLLLLMIGEFVLIEVFGRFVLAFFTSFFGFYFIYDILISLFKVLYAVVAIYFFVVIMKRRYLRYKNQVQQPGVMEDVSKIWSDEKQTEEHKLYHQRDHSFDWGKPFFKIVLCMIALPVILLLAGGGIIFVLYIMYCVSYQVMSWGILLMGVGGIVGCASVLWGIWYLWPKGGENHA